MQEHQVEFENPPDRTWFTAVSFVVAYAVILFLVLFLIAGNAILILMGIALAAIVGVVNFAKLRQYPLKVVIVGEKVELHYRRGRRTSHYLNAIADIYFPRAGSLNHYAAYRLIGNNRPVCIIPEIAYAVDASYEKATGSRLPLWNGKSNQKVRRA